MVQRRDRTVSNNYHKNERGQRVLNHSIPTHCTGPSFSFRIKDLRYRYQFLCLCVKYNVPVPNFLSNIAGIISFCENFGPNGSEFLQEFLSDFVILINYYVND